MAKSSTNPGTLRGRRAVLLLLMQALGVTGAGAQVFVGAESSGSLLLSNFQCDHCAVLLVAGEAAPAAGAPAASTASPAFAGALRTGRAATGAMLSLIQDVAREHAIPADLLTAVISVESGFDARAVSPKGAKGLMQLMPATARRFGVKDVFAPRENLQGGAAYLRQLMHMFDGDLALALAAYNAGEGAVLRAGRQIPPYPETRQYVDLVLARAGGASAQALNVR